MKKSKRFFSFVGVALCAVMLLGSVGTLSSRHVAEAQSLTSLSKVYGIDKLKDIQVSNSGTNSTPTYLEYGEYPQSRVSDADQTTLRNLLKSEVYANKEFSAAVLDSPAKVLAQRIIKSNTTSFSYNKDNGYFTLKTQVGSLPAGTKIYEYISGVDSLQKYPTYITSTSGQKTFQDTRSYATAATLDTISAATYHNSTSTANNYTACNCSTCNYTCPTTAVQCVTGTGSSSSWTNISTVNWTNSTSHAYTVSFSATNDHTNTHGGGLWGRRYPEPGDGVTKTVTYNLNGTTPIGLGSSSEYEKQLQLVIKKLLEGKSSKGNLKKIQVTYSNKYNKKKDWLGITYTDSITFSASAYVWAGNDQGCANCYINHNAGSTSNIRKVSTARDIVGQKFASSVTQTKYAASNVNYFLVEPIKWRIVENNDGILTLQSDIILDSINYNLFTSNGTNFNQSYLRNWLNNGSPASDEKYNVLKNSGGNSYIVNAPISERNTNTYSYLAESSSSEIYTASAADRKRMINANKSDYDDNLAAYYSAETTYSNSNPTFYKMAFTNEKTVKADTVLVPITQETKGTRNYSLTDYSETADNYVTIPYSEKYSIYYSSDDKNAQQIKFALGTKTSSLNSANVRPYSDFAEAAGLVCHYNSSYSTYNSSNDRGIVWLWGSSDTSAQKGYNNGVMHEKNVGLFTNAGVISVSNNVSYDQINQTGGVVPIIRMDLKKMMEIEGEAPAIKGISGVSSTLDYAEYDLDNNDSDTAITDEISKVYNTNSFTRGTTLKFVNKGETSTSIKVESYEVNRQNEDYTITVNLTGATSVKYLKVAFGDTTFINNVNATGLDWNLTGSYPYFLVLKQFGTGSFTFKLSDSNDPQKTYRNMINSLSNTTRTFHMYIFAVTEEVEKVSGVINKTILKETYVADSDIKQGSISYTTPSITAGSQQVSVATTTITKYEGETLVLPSSEFGEGYMQYYAGYDIAKFNETAGMEYTVLGDPVVVKNKQNVDETTLVCKRDGWYKNNGTALITGRYSPEVNQDGDITGFSPLGEDDESVYISHLYKDGIEQSFSIGVKPDGTKAAFNSFINNVIYMEYTDKDGKTQTKDFSGGIETLNTQNYYRLDTDFKIYVKTKYLSSFSSVLDIMSIKGAETNPFVQIQAYGTSGQVVFDTSQANGTVGKAAVVKESDEKWTYTTTSGSYHPTLVVEGPFDSKVNGLVIEKYYTFKMTGIPSGGLATDQKYAFVVMPNEINSNDLNPDVYSFNYTSEKTTLKHATVTNGIEDPIKGKIEASQIKDIQFNSSIMADIVFNKGYSLDKDSNGKAIMPTMNFDYGAQALDDKGYSITKNARYSGDTTSKLGTQSSAYQGEYIRLDADGNMLNFDNNHNLKYYHDKDELTNIKGAYGYHNSSNQVFDLMVPMLILDINEKNDNISGDFAKNVLFVPYITIDGTTSLPHNEIFQSKFSQIVNAYRNNNFTIEYKPADLSDRNTHDPNSGNPNYTPYTYILNSLSLLADVSGGTETELRAIVKEKLIALGFGSTAASDDATMWLDIRDYYEKVFNMKLNGSYNTSQVKLFIQGCITTFIDSLGNTTYNTDRLVNDRIRLLQGDSWAFDRQAYLQNGTVGKEENYATVLINKSRNKDEQKMAMRGNNTYSLSAIYSHYQWTSSSHVCKSTFSFMNEYGNEMVGLNLISEDNGGGATQVYRSSKLTPVDEADGSSFPIWSIKVNTELNNDGAGYEKTGTGYKYYELSSGEKHANWNYESRQWLYYNISTGEATKMYILNGVPCVTLHGTRWGAVYEPGKEISGKRALYKMEQNNLGNWIATSTRMTGEYIVTFTRPITANIYLLETDNAIRPCVEDTGEVVQASEEYRKGDVIIRLSANNVVSRINMTIKDHMISNHQYPVEFYSNFGGNYTGITPLFDGAFVEPGSTMQGLRELTDQFANMVTNDSTGDVIKFIPYEVRNANFTDHYFMAPIDIVAQSGANDIGLVFDDGQYKVGGLAGNALVIEMNNGVQCYKEPVSGDYYYFTEEILEFKGWTLVTKDRITNSDPNVRNWANVQFCQEAFFDKSDLTKINDVLFNLEGAFSYKTVTEAQLYDVMLNFTNNSASVVLEAVYQTIGLKVELFGWNMNNVDAADQDSDHGTYNGVYNILKKHSTYPGLGDYINVTNHSLKNVDDLGIPTDIVYGDTLKNQVYTTLSNAIDSNTYLGKQATAYGTMSVENNSVWYEQVVDAKTFVQNTIFNGNNIDLTYRNYSDMETVLSGYEAVRIWDNEINFFTNTNRDYYFRITQEAPNRYYVEAFKKFLIEETRFTNNTKLYQVYETNVATVTLTGQSDVFSLYDYQPTISMGTDFVATFGVSDQYSQYLADITSLLSKFTVKVNTRHAGVLQEANSSFKLSDRYTNPIMDEGSPIVAVTVVDGIITLTISGVVSDIVIEGTNDFSRNNYSMTIANPAYGENGELVTDAEGNALSYGTFYLVGYDENSDTKQTKHELKFSVDGKGEIELLTQESGSYTITVDFDPANPKELTLTFEYGALIILEFERHVAFSQYIDTVNFGGTNHRPFKISNSAGLMTMISYEEFTASNNDNEVQWVQGAEAKAAQYRILRGIDDYTLEWKDDISLNAYEVNNSSDKYSVTLYDDEDAQDIFNENVVINRDPATDLNPGEVDAYTLNAASYNQNVIMEFTVDGAYSNFVPVLTQGGHLITFPHVYKGIVVDGKVTQNYRQTIYYAAGNSSVTITAVKGEGDALDHYTYNYKASASDLVGKDYRVEGHAETAGKYAGYYKVSYKKTSESPYEEIGYIRYDEYANKYYYTLNGVTAPINANLTSYSSMDNQWSEDNKNTHSVTLGTVEDNPNTSLSADKNTTYYTFSAHTINGTVNPDGTITGANEIRTISDLSTLVHGTMLRFKVVMKSNYTQTIPHFAFIIGEKTYQLADAIAEQGMTFEFDTTKTPSTSEGKQLRVNKFTIGGLTFTVTQTVTLDNSFDDYSEFRTQMGLNRNENESKLYKTATYTFDFVITDSFTMAHGSYVANEEVDENTDGDQKIDRVHWTPIYTTNTYYVIFNKYANGGDQGPLQYIPIDEHGNPQPSMYYYQEVSQSNSYKATNPFREVGDSITGPDGYTPINKTTFSSSTIAGYTYSGAGSFTTTQGAQFSFSTNIDKHTVLRAQYTEEQYTTKIQLMDSKYGTTWYQSATASSYSRLSSSSTIVANGNNVLYNQTTFRTKFVMNSKYDNSSMRFNISTYGQLKFPTDSDVNFNGTAYTFSNTVNSVQYDFKINVDETQKATNNTVIYNYYLGSKNIVQIKVDETAKVNGTRNGDSKDSTVYELIIVSPIDAGNTSTDPNPSTLTVSMNFVVNPDSTKANETSHENIYSVAFLKPKFETTPLSTIVSGQTDVTYGDSEYNTYTGWSNYPTVNNNVVENDTNSIVSDYYVVSIPHGQKVKMASTLPEGTSEKDDPALVADTNTIYYIYQSVPGFTFNGWSDKGNANASWKDGDPIDDKFRPTMTINDVTPSGFIYQDYTLYAKYKESTCNGITYINNDVETAGTVIFQTKSFSKNSAIKYSDEVTATFTLNSVYAGSSNIQFEVNGASLKSVSYINNGATAKYELVVSYFTATDRVSIQIINIDSESDLTKSTHTITFKDYTYSSTIDQSNAIWTETITVNPASIQIGTGAIVDKLENIQNNVIVSSVTNWGSVNWDLDNRNNGGLVFQGWFYIKHAAVINAEDVVEIIRATLNGYIPSGQMLLGHEVGMFYANETVVASSMYVVPYFTRNTYNITINQQVENNVLDDSDERVITGYANNLTYTIPYGFPVMNTKLEDYIAGQSSLGSIYQKVYTSYNTIKNIDSAARAISADNVHVNHIFAAYYANGVENANGLEGILVDGTLTTVNVRFERKSYTVTIKSGTTASAVEVCQVEVKYGDNLTLDMVATEDGDTVGDLLHHKEFTNASTGKTYKIVDESQGQFLAGWYHNGSTVYGEAFTVLADSTIAPFVSSQAYLFKEIADGFVIDAVGVDGLTVTERDSDGFFRVTNNQYITIGFYPNDGWTSDPVVTLSIDGVVIASGSNTEEIGNNLSLTTIKETNNGKDYITVRLQGFGQCLAITNDSKVLITLSPVQNLYEAEIVNGQNIVVEYASGDVIFTYDEANKAYKYGETAAVLFSYDKFVSHGETFHFTVAIDSKYASMNTKVDFVIRDSANNERRYGLANGAQRPDNASGIMYYDFTFANVQGNISIDIDEVNSTIRAKQFTITYNYVFGGGVNGWEYRYEGDHYTFEKNENYQHFVDVRVDGQKLETPGTKEDANYTLYSNVWYVLKDSYTDMRLINKHNIEEYCNVFNMTSHNFTESFNVFAFYIVDTYVVSPEDTSASKGGFELPSINNQYVADHKGEGSEAQGYTFSYVLDASYSKSQPVISIVGANASYDFIVIDVNNLTAEMTVKKSDSVIYTIGKTTTGYVYSVGLGAGEGTYIVTIANGVYTFKQGEKEIATASLNGLKTTITLNTITETFAINVNDETFDINQYSVKFVYSDGSSEEVAAVYGSKLSNIPTESTSFIQKVVYVVTHADGTTEKLSSKELEKLEITEDLTIELSVELNFIILIPLVVGAVVIIVVIVVVIAKAAGNAGYKRSSGSANSAAFDKLNQSKSSGASNEASKKSDKPYNPYIGNRDKK